jgi:hypothetical protein
MPIAEFSNAICHRRSARRRAGYFLTSIWSPFSEIKPGIRGFQEKVARSPDDINESITRIPSFATRHRTKIQ